MDGEVAGHTEGQHHCKERVCLPKGKFLAYWKLLHTVALLQPPINSRQRATSGFQQRNLRWERSANCINKLNSEDKEKTHCNMLQLPSAFQRFFTQTWDHFHCKERTRFARINYFRLCCISLQLLQYIATAVSVETVVQTHLGPFPLERTYSICPDKVFFDFVAYCCNCCKMLQLQSALKRLFRQTWDHFHWKERTQFARIQSFLDLLHITASIARCCKGLMQVATVKTDFQNRPNRRKFGWDVPFKTYKCWG